MGGGGLLSFLHSYTEHRSSFNGWLERQFRIRVQGKVWSLIVKTSEGGVECDLFPALSGRGQGSRISIAAPLKEAVTIKINKSQQYRLNILSSEETEDAHADTQTISASSSVGYEAAMKKHSNHGCKHGSAAPIFIRLEGCINDETEDF